MHFDFESIVIVEDVCQKIDYMYFLFSTFSPSVWYWHKEDEPHFLS